MKKSRADKSQSSGPGQLEKRFATHHYRAAKESLQTLLRHPLSGLMTIAVIAIALSLPTLLLLILGNVQSLGGAWQNQQAQITVYFKQDVDQQRASDIKQQIAARSDIGEVEYIPPQQALQEFESTTGLQNIEQNLGDNPMPALLIVYPGQRYQQMGMLKRLQREFQSIPQVAEAQLNKQWIQRLFAMTELARRLVYTVGALLVLGVALVVGNTVHLATQHRQQEIIVYKLIGASERFIRRPFVYTGLWYGLLGGLLAWGIVNFSMSWLSTAVAHLGALYHTTVHWSGMTGHQSLMLLIISTSLGGIGAHIVARHYIKNCIVH